MATLEPACPNCGEMMLDGRSHLNCQSRRERIASLERTVGEQADQIGGLVSELERVTAQRDDIAEAGIRDVRGMGVLLNKVKQQLAASQTEAAALRLALVGADWIIKKLAPHETMAIMIRGYKPSDEDIATGTKYRKLIDDALATPSAAAERVQALEDVAKAARIYNRLYRLFHREGQQLRAALAALDAATARNPRTGEEVKGE